MTTKVDLVKQAHAEQLALVNNIRCQLIKALTDLDEIGGKDKPRESLLAIVNAHPAGVQYSLLKNVFEDAVLGTTREILITQGLIQQIGKRGDDVILKPADKRPVPAAKVVETAEVIDAELVTA